LGAVLEPGALRGTLAIQLKVVVLVVVLCLPLVSRSLGTPVGAFSMFERLERYRLMLFVRTAAGEREVHLRRLAPHLSHAAQRIVMPAECNAWGADQVQLLAGGLDDLAALVCQLQPEAISVRAELIRTPLRSNAWTQALEHPCRR
jgi:hypothetical protein